MSELNKAEKYLMENLTRLAEEGCLDENPRPKYKDGTSAHSLFITGVYETYDITKGEIPITETRPIYFKKALSEISWIYQLQTSELQPLKDMSVDFWDEWKVSGTNGIGQRYGATVKKYDLMNKLLDGLVNDKFSRRHIINLYQYADFEETEGLYPCFFQTMFSVRKVNNEYYLDMTLTSRANDYLVAGFINRIEYLAFQMMVACHCGYNVGKFNVFVQNLHIYSRHAEQVEETVKRIQQLKKREFQSQPQLILNVPSGTNFYDIKPSDFELIDYNPIKPQMTFELGI